MTQNKSPKLQTRLTIRIAQIAFLIVIIYVAVTSITGTSTPPVPVELATKAHNGDPQAQYDLGMAYRKGQQGLAQNDQEAFNWISKAAQSGHAEAQNELGFMYGSGLGTAQNHAEAFNWLSKAAHQNFPLAQLNLGIWYCLGQGVPKNTQEGINWLNKAASNGRASDAQASIRRYCE